MQTAFIVVSAIVGVLIFALDILSGLFSGRWMLWASAALHPAFVILLHFAGASLPLAAMLLMASAATLTLTSYIKHEYIRKRGEADDL